MSEHDRNRPARNETAWAIERGSSDATSMETLLSGDANDEARASSSAATPQAEPGASASDTALVKALEVVGPVTPDGESTFHTDSLPSHHP